MLHLGAWDKAAENIFVNALSYDNISNVSMSANVATAVYVREQSGLFRSAD